MEQRYALRWVSRRVEWREAPLVYFGGEPRCLSLRVEALGNVGNCVEPFLALAQRCSHSSARLRNGERQSAISADIWRKRLSHAPDLAAKHRTGQKRMRPLTLVIAGCSSGYPALTVLLDSDAEASDAEIAASVAWGQVSVHGDRW